MFSPGKLKRSLFVRIAILFAVGLAASLLTAILAGHTLYSAEERPRSMLVRLVQGMHAVLQKELPSPITRENIAEFASRHPELEIAVWKHPDLVFSSLSEPLDLERFSRPGSTAVGDLKVISSRHRVYAMGEKDGVTLVFSYDFHPSKLVVVKTFLTLGLMIIVVFGLVHRFVRKELAPLHDLRRGTHELSLGNFNFRLSEAPTAEFDEIVTSFNTMAEKLETLFVNNTLMIGNLSHDLKSHLTRLRMSAEVELDDPRVRVSFTDEIRALNDYLERTLQAFRVSTDRATCRPETAILQDFVREVVKRQVEANPGFQPTLRLSPEPLEVSIDRHFFGILLGNLLENAIHYGTGIVVSAEGSQGRFELEVTNRMNSSLSPENVPFLSQPFFRGESARSGTEGHSGLGLYICRKIAEAHGFRFSIQVRDSLFLVSLEGKAR